MITNGCIHSDKIVPSMTISNPVSKKRAARVAGHEVRGLRGLEGRCLSSWNLGSRGLEVVACVFRAAHNEARRLVVGPKAWSLGFGTWGLRSLGASGFSVLRLGLGAWGFGLVSSRLGLAVFGLGLKLGPRELTLERNLGLELRLGLERWLGYLVD